MKTIQSGSEVLRKGPWMPEEDEILVEYVHRFGARDWSSIRSKGLLPRTGKSCRLRWVNKLKPDLKRSGCKFSAEEEKLVVEMQAKLGNKWAKIASCLLGRTDNDVKNFWSTRQKRILRALQRPKITCCSSTDAATDIASKSPLFCSNYEAHQVHSRSEASLVPSSFTTSFVFEDDCHSSFKEPSSHLYLRHSSLAANDMLSLKLHEMVAVGSQSAGSDLTAQCGRASDDLKEESVTYHSHSNNVMMIPSQNLRSSKRRPRSRRDARSCFEHPAMGNDQGILDSSVHTLEDIELPLTEGNLRDLVAPLSPEQQSSNYFDFLVQNEASSSLQGSQMFSHELHTFLNNNQQHQWEKLPMLCSNEPSLHELNIKESDSCSPDSVIYGFTADVFDSLEPLCAAAPEWWVQRLD